MEAPHPESTPTPAPTPAAPAAPADSSRIRVLLADDEEQFRIGLARRLERVGFACTLVVNGHEALQQLQAQEFDVLLADIDMPGNKDLELLGKIPPECALPTVLLTGRPAVETAARSVEYRVAAYLLKPPEFEELCRVLRSAAEEGANLRRVRENRARLQNWEQELGQLQRLLSQASAADRSSAMRSYLRITLRNLVISLVELENLLNADGDGGARVVERQALLTALQKTVTVLEKTKGQFKSKELGDLRKEIESLLG